MLPRRSPAGCALTAGQGLRALRSSPILDPGTAPQARQGSLGFEITERARIFFVDSPERPAYIRLNNDSGTAAGDEEFRS